MDRKHILRRNRQNDEYRKIQVLTHYGPNHKLRCSWPKCRIQDSRILVLDHINDNGAEHRAFLGSRSSSTLYRWIQRNLYPKGFQTLCWNHNALREYIRRRKARSILGDLMDMP